MRILLTGRNGQLGTELERALAPLGEIAAFGRQELDLADPDSLRDAVKAAAPDLIVNAAAYTAVDQAEAEAGQAYAVNAAGPAVLAEEARRAGALLVHYSTDYVFDGTQDRPYAEGDRPNPLGVYGASKLEGERAIQASGCRYFLLRTCWVYGSRGRNFLLTLLRLASERPELRVVGDQVGTPTWSREIALATAELLRQKDRDDALLVHVANAGYASWFQFADEIVRRTAASRARQPVLVPIQSAEYPTAARRPLNSRLSTEKLTLLLGHSLPRWQDSLEACLAARAD